jgi:hypothetical protein
LHAKSIEEIGYKVVGINQAKHSTFGDKKFKQYLSQKESIIIPVFVPSQYYYTHSHRGI